MKDSKRVEEGVLKSIKMRKRVGEKVSWRGRELKRKSFEDEETE
jgi:hypothetical protein